MKEKFKQLCRDYRFVLWLLLGMSIVVARLLFIVGSAEECQRSEANIYGVTDQTQTGNIEQDADKSNASTPSFQFVVNPAKSIKMHSFSVLMIRQLTYTNDGDAKGSHLNQVLIKAMDGRKNRKYQNYKPTKDKELVPLVHDHFTDEFDHPLLRSTIYKHCIGTV